jgi:hypothetical protein
MRRLAIALLFLFSASSVLAQVPAASATAPTPPPPATKMEAFRPAAGAVETIGFNKIGTISGISVDARELRDGHSHVVRGLVVTVRENQYREERSFVDADEIPELLKGVDALLAMTTNPTQFKDFEVRYTTKGEVELTAFSNSKDEIE